MDRSAAMSEILFCFECMFWRRETSFLVTAKKIVLTKSLWLHSGNLCFSYRYPLLLTACVSIVISGLSFSQIKSEDFLKAYRNRIERKGIQNIF